MAILDRYKLYEYSVQSPSTHAEWLVEIYRKLSGGGYPTVLREDFCGTFALSAAWVKRNRNNYAIGVDLDSAPLDYGHAHHMKSLSPAQRKRLKVIRGDVRYAHARQADVTLVGNFSFFCLKARKELIEYFKSAKKALKPGGLFVLEMAGGPGMISKIRERRVIKPRKNFSFTYEWDQRSFDPIHRNAHYSIHFKLSDGTSIRNAFTYDWRLWTIPEVRDALAEAGFKKAVVLWEPEEAGSGTGEYVVSEKGDNAHAWIAYVVGIA
jgi:SAM-dependent methyltransferase